MVFEIFLKSHDTVVAKNEVFALTRPKSLHVMQKNLSNEGE